MISECICQGYNATYECNVVGPGSTVWKGDGFRDCSNNRITLFHSQFSGGTVGTCNSGAIVGRSIRVENNCYTSQLNIFVSPNVIGRDVFCAYDNGLNEVDVGNSTVTLTTGTKNNCNMKVHMSYYNVIILSVKYYYTKSWYIWLITFKLSCYFHYSSPSTPN